MARETERDTYGGKRRWAEGAGESWASGRRSGSWGARSDRLTDPESARWQGSRARESEGGVLRQLADELGITTPTPQGYQRSDERIREDVCERLWDEPHVEVGEVTVEVRDGVVILEGSVPQRQMKHAIEDIAAACRGVSDVDNRIRVAPEPRITPHPGL
jgi:hypothetical protein